MTTLGVSVYPDLRPAGQIAAYLRLAARYGYTRVFSSMFSMEGTPQEVLACFGDLIATAHDCGMEVALDVNPLCMERLGATPDDLSVFAGIGADILRMDGAYDEDDNYRMLCNPYGIRVEYNASSLDPAAIAALVERGASKDRMLACHNFYPQRYTGMRWDAYLEVNRRLAPLGIRVGAFVASHAPNTHGVWDATCGLPTVERMRDYPADLQARLLVAGGATDVLFGNAYASEEELGAVAEAVAAVAPVFSPKRVEAIRATFGADVRELAAAAQAAKKVRVEPVYDLSDVESEVLFDFFPHLDFGDSSEWIWRTRAERVAFAGEAIAPRRFAGSEFPVGSVLVVNDNYRHYAAEVQVALRPLVNDGTRNLVGRIDEQEMTMFDVIGPRDVVVFLPARG